MPHDIYGNDLKPGNTVQMTYRVKAVHQTEQDCNVDLEAVGSASYLPSITCNSKLVERTSYTRAQVENLVMLLRRARPSVSPELAKQISDYIDRNCPDLRGSPLRTGKEDA